MFGKSTRTLYILDFIFGVILYNKKIIINIQTVKLLLLLLLTSRIHLYAGL